jgi:hypothetical protein
MILQNGICRRYWDFKFSSRKQDLIPSKTAIHFLSGHLWESPSLSLCNLCTDLLSTFSVQIQLIRFVVRIPSFCNRFGDWSLPMGSSQVPSHRSPDSRDSSFTAGLSLYSRFVRKILVRYPLTVGSVHQPCRGFVSFRSVQISSNKSSAQLAVLSTFSSVQVECQKPFSRQSIRFKSSVQVAVLSTIGSIEVECPSRRSLDSRFNSGRVPEAVLSTIDSIQVECPSRRSLDSSEFSSLLDALLQYAFLERRYRCLCICSQALKEKKKVMLCIM